MIGIIMFGVCLLMLLWGFPVAFTFGGVALLFGLIAEGPQLFAFMPYRIMSIMENTTLMAVPLFIFMGLVLQRTKLAEQLLESMGKLFGGVRGGLAISTILVGALLAASTGVVGASVVAMGLISLPVMLHHGYKTELAAGTICASGTLGQIIPPSIILIILGDVMGLPVGDLFKAAVVPGLVLIGLYVAYILIMAFLKPEIAPAMPRDESQSRAQEVRRALLAVIPPLALIIVVLAPSSPVSPHPPNPRHWVAWARSCWPCCTASSPGRLSGTRQRTPSRSLRWYSPSWWVRRLFPWCSATPAATTCWKNGCWRSPAKNGAS